jgi:hypothetical protein
MGSLMMTNPQMFLSYAREDEIVVRAIYQKLKEAGFSAWMDTQNILPGQRWQYQIKRALQNAELIIAFLSLISIEKRGFLQKEIRVALERLQEKLDSDIYLIPVRLDNCEVPASLSDIQWVNMFAADGWEQLKLAITSALQMAHPKRVLERLPEVAAGTTPPHKITPGAPSQAPSPSQSGAPNSRIITISGSVHESIIVAGDLDIGKHLRPNRRKSK